MDRYLDEVRFGPAWLRKEELAELVQRSIEYAAYPMQFYTLFAWVIMSNHIHLLVGPRVIPARFLQSVKGYTAREANRILQRTGKPFWQSESYDRWIRDEREFERVRRYIEYNPVRAGLVASAEQYRWPSAYAGHNYSR